jgi:hypothetical protein
MPSDAAAATSRLNKVNQWKADFEACLAPVAAVDAAASSSSGHTMALPSSAVLEALEARYKELECIVPDHKRIEPLLRDYKRWRERHRPWSEFFLWCRAARAGCFLSGDGYDPSLASAYLPNATLSIPIKRVKSEEPLLLASSKSATDRRRRSPSDAPPASPPVVGKKTGRDGGKKVEEEELDNTLYVLLRVSFVAGFVL